MNTKSSTVSSIGIPTTSTTTSLTSYCSRCIRPLSSCVCSSITYSTGNTTSTNIPINSGNTGYFYTPTHQQLGSYCIEHDEQEDALVIRDKNGNECMSFKDGMPMIGGKTIHQVILDVIELYTGALPVTTMLVDPDKGKRFIANEIFQRRKMAAETVAKVKRDVAIEELENKQ